MTRSPENPPAEQHDLSAVVHKLLATERDHLFRDLRAAGVSLEQSLAAVSAHQPDRCLTLGHARLAALLEGA